MKRSELNSIFDITEQEALKFRVDYFKTLLEDEGDRNDRLVTLEFYAKDDQKWLPVMMLGDSDNLVAKYRKSIFYLKKRLKYLKDKNPDKYIPDPMEIEEIKKISICDYLKAHGYRPEYSARTMEKYKCIFHNEKTGSMSVDKNKNLFHCFGCGQGGSILDIAMQIHSCSLSEAIKILL